MTERQSEHPYFDEATELLQRAQKTFKSGLIGVTEATYKPHLKWKDRPFGLLLATDMHYGSIKTDYARLGRCLDIIENTPNMGMVSNGDDVDVFTAVGKWATGTYENPLPPQLQTLAMLERLKVLDDKNKIGAMSYGNHNDGISPVGYDWLESFCREFKAPVFPSGGLLNVDLVGAQYKLAMWHRHWGTSKLNPGNAVRRFLQWEYPDADIGFLGHTHQSNMEHMEIGGKERLGFIGGTFKLLGDDFARKLGIGGRSGQPEWCVLLWPDRKLMLGVKGVEVARKIILSK